MQIKLALGLVLLMGQISPVFADESVPKKKPNFSAAIFNRASTNAFPAGDSRHQAELSSFGFLGYRLSDQWSLVSLLEISKQLNGAEKLRLSNPDIRLFKKGPEFGRSIRNDSGEEAKSFSVRYGPAVILPANYDSIYNENFIFGVNAIARLLFDFSAYGAKGLSGFYDVSLGKQFQKFDTTVDGRSLVPVKLRHLAFINYNLSKKWDILVTGGLSTGWTYDGQVTSSYSTSQEIDFSINDTFQVGIGHQIGQSLLSSNGQDLSFNLFSEKDSSFYLSLNITL